jgi:internalin A
LPHQLFKATFLKSLDISYNLLSSLPPEIEQLSQLTQIIMSYNKICSFPPAIGRLLNLHEIIAYNNNLSSLPSDIGELKSLKRLNLANNRMSHLPHEIGKLNELIYLNLTHNQFSYLPPTIRKLNNLKQLLLEGNPALKIPPEILSKPDNASAIIAALMEDREPLSEAKMLVVGQGSVGKTSLIRQLLYKNFDEKESKTDGIEIHKWVVMNTISSTHPSINLNIWDFGGQEIMHATHQFFLRECFLSQFVANFNMRRMLAI